jgi:hypothetical protein
MVGINTYPISLMDARKLKDAMADVVAKQLVAASQLLVQEVKFWSHGTTVRIRRGMEIHCLGRTARRHALIYT